MDEDTTVSVRGVDLQTWKEFQKAIIDMYGNLYGYLGHELSRALNFWLEKNRLSITPTQAKTHSAKAVKEYVREAMESLGGEATIQQVCGYLREKYPEVNLGSISTGMSDLSTNGPPSSLYPMDQRILQRVSRGRYRLLRGK